MWLSVTSSDLTGTTAAADRPLILDQYLKWTFCIVWHCFIRLIWELRDVLVHTRTLLSASVSGHLVLQHFHRCLHYCAFQAWCRHHLPIHKWHRCLPSRELHFRPDDIHFCMCRNSYHICQVQVCGEAEWGHQGGEPPPQLHSTGVWAALLFGHVYCCNIPGNSCDVCSWYRSSDVLCAWYIIHNTPVGYILSCLSIWVLHVCVSSTLVYRHPCRFSVLSHCHLCVLCEASHTAQRQRWRGLSLPCSQRLVWVGLCFQFHLLLPHIHPRFQTVYLTSENRRCGVVSMSLQLPTNFVFTGHQCYQHVLHLFLYTFTHIHFVKKRKISVTVPLHILIEHKSYTFSKLCTLLLTVASPAWHVCSDLWPVTREVPPPPHSECMTAANVV